MSIIAKAPGVVAFSASGNALSTTISGTGSTSVPRIFGASPALLTTNGGSLPTTAPCSLTAPGSGRVEGKLFRVVASGWVTTGAALTVTPYMLAAVTLPAAASQLTVSSYTTIADPTGVAIGSATTVPWSMELVLEGDSVSGILQGTCNTLINNTYTASTALASTLTSVNFSTEPAFYVVPAFLFGTSNASNLVTLDNFVVVAE